MYPPHHLHVKWLNPVCVHRYKLSAHSWLGAQCSWMYSCAGVTQWCYQGLCVWGQGQGHGTQGWGQGLEKQQAMDKDKDEDLKPMKRTRTWDQLKGKAKKKVKTNYIRKLLRQQHITINFVRFCTFWTSLVASYYCNSLMMKKKSEVRFTLFISLRFWEILWESQKKGTCETQIIRSISDILREFKRFSEK